jgi:hypothetical protein
VIAEILQDERKTIAIFLEGDGPNDPRDIQGLEDLILAPQAGELESSGILCNQQLGHDRNTITVTVAADNPE